MYLIYLILILIEAKRFQSVQSYLKDMFGD